MDEFGASLEVDFHTHYRLSLHDFFRGVLPWGKLFRLADALPTASCYKSQLLMDEERAAVALGAELVPEPLSFVDETPVVVGLRNVCDLLNQLIWVTGGGGRRPPEPFPRPVTALERLQEKQDQAAVDEVLGLLGVE